MFKKIMLLLSLAANSIAFAQTKADVTSRDVMRIESVLASDSMRGRKAGTPDIDHAADFIAGEFRKAALKPFQRNSFLQEFSMIKPRRLETKAEMDDQEINASQVIALTQEEELKLDENSGYVISYIGKDDNYRSRIQEVVNAKTNSLVFVDSIFARSFPRLAGFKSQSFKTEGERSSNVVFILGNYHPRKFKIKTKQSNEAIKFANVVGVLPGKSRKNEYVIFSAHYDHLGVAANAQNADSIYNGANDDAAGTTAVIALANYFKKLHNNERTLIFVAFTAEEIGGFGSQYFSRQLDPAAVVAMFNIEMIGTESKWGRNTAYITGFDRSNMGAILQKNLQNSSFSFYPDPYTTENLFYRSDNATLARLGVPAHTISTAKMENEPNYHKPGDEIGTLDIENMTAIIEAIALSSKSIVSGADTPSRVTLEK